MSHKSQQRDIRNVVNWINICVLQVKTETLTIISRLGVCYASTVMSVIFEITQFIQCQ